MYWDIPQGSKINIQGLICSIPPAGYVVDIKTKGLRYVGIYKRSLINEEQYWERIPVPSWYHRILKEEDAYERKRKDGEEPYYNEEYEKYKQQEWDRRLNGFWYMNNGVATYITGSHYIYMQWWMIDIGYPSFRMPDLEYFYFLQYCIEDTDCMGMLEITKRRFGKTFRGGLFLYEYVTRTKMTNAGIQSKTGSDANKVFAKAVINPFIKLPRFFRPEYDMSGGIRPKTAIRFQQTNVRGRKSEEILDKEELGSMIDHQSADPLAYDGQKEHRMFQDEWAKTIECNIYDRHDVIRYCLLDDEGRIIGKVLYSSTVEKLDTDKEGVQEGARKLWNDSDHLHKEENGRTPTGLYRFFMTAKRARNFNRYGFPDEEKTLKEILSDRKSVEHNPRSLSARIRKEALTIEEAFSIDADGCQFNVNNISEQRKIIEQGGNYLRKVTFYRNANDEVSWRDDPNGLWEILAFPPFGKENIYLQDGRFKAPSRMKEVLISVDSYSGYQGGRKYGSTACGLIFDKTERKFIGMYYGRPQYKEQLHEQLMMAGEYYSAKIFYEFTADDYEGYFRTRNKQAYLGRFPMSAIEPTKRETTERLYGFPITPFAMTKQLDEMILYIENECHKIFFDKILEQCLVFDPYDRTKSDCVVSAMIAVVSALDVINIHKAPKDPLIQMYGETKTKYTNPALAEY